MAEEYISVGKLGKPHGIAGAFRFLLHRQLKSKAKFPKHFLLHIKGSYLPWFIAEAELTGFDNGLLKFEDITSPEKARTYSGCELFLTEKDVNTYFRKDAEGYNFLKGYQVSDETAGPLGALLEVEETPAQLLITVDYSGREVLIPLVDDFIVELNKRKKTLLLNLPEGLLDL